MYLDELKTLEKSIERGEKQLDALTEKRAHLYETMEAVAARLESDRMRLTLLRARRRVPEPPREQPAGPPAEISASSNGAGTLPPVRPDAPVSNGHALAPIKTERIEAPANGSEKTGGVQSVYRAVFANYKSLELPDGSILTLDLETNIFDLPKRERELVFGIVDLVQDYEKERI